MRASSTRSVVVALGLVGAALLAFVLVERPRELEQQPAQRAPSDRSEGEALQQLRTQVERLQRRLDKTRSTERSADDLSKLQELEARVDAIGAGALDPAHALLEPELSYEEGAARERQRTQGLIRFLEENFQREGRDDTWAEATEQAVSSTLRAELGLTPGQLTCQASLCKVEMQHTDSSAEQLFLHKLLHVRELGDTEAFSERHEREDGSISTLTYVARPGHRLPEPQAI